MSEVKKVSFTVDGKPAAAIAGVNVVEALRENGITVPTLCWIDGMDSCLGTCRVCTVRINGKETASCSQTIAEGMVIECETEELNDLRKGVVELLFVEGNHFCPACEKSGDCDLQGTAYALGMTHPRFPYRFSHYDLDFRGVHLLLERNRCIHCKRCTDAFVDDDNNKVFSFVGKGKETRVQMDMSLEAKLPDHKREEAMRLCPVGAIIFKGKGFDRPIGTRRYDHMPASEGHAIETATTPKADQSDNDPSKGARQGDRS
jgi:[NiFe] hydrogenase diaphorase moiety small subunit